MCSSDLPQGNFLISSKFKFLPKPPDMLANFMLVSYLKTILRCRLPFSHNELISGGHFWAKKHNIQQGDKIFFDLKSFETYGGLTPSTSQISIPSLVVLRCPADAQPCLKVLKIQQRGYPREIFRSAQNIIFSQIHLICWQISCSFHI